MQQQKNFNALVLTDKNENSNQAVNELVPLLKADNFCTMINVGSKETEVNSYFFEGFLARLFVTNVSADMGDTFRTDYHFKTNNNMASLTQYDFVLVCMNKYDQSFIDFLYKTFPKTRIMSYQTGKKLNNLMPSEMVSLKPGIVRVSQ